MAKEPYITSMEFKKPFEWLADDPWSWIADYSDSREYTELDDMWNVLDGDWSIGYFNEQHDTDITIDDVKREYQERFPKLLAQAMKNMAEDIMSGGLVLKMDYKN